MATPANTNETPAVKELSAEDKAKAFSSLPAEIQTAIDNLNKVTEKHNANVDIVARAASEKTDPKKLLHEIREQNPAKDKKLTELNKQIAELDEMRENLIGQADKIAEKYLPKKTSDDEAKVALEATKESSKAIREQHAALKVLEKFFPYDFAPHLLEMKSTRGMRLTTPDTSLTPGVRPQWEKIFVLSKDFVSGDEVAEHIFKTVEKKNEDGTIVTENRSNATYLAQELTKRIKGASVSSGEINAQFMKFLGDRKLDTITKGESFDWEFTKEIPNSDGEIIDTKVFPLRFVK